MSHIMKSISLWLVELFLGEINDSVKKGLWLLVRLVQKHRFFISILLFLGISVGFIEGAAIGFIAYSAVVVTGSEQECSEIISQISSLFGLSVCEEYDKYKIFLYLVYASIAIQVLKSCVVYINGYLGIVLKTRIAYEVRYAVIEKLVKMDFQDSSMIPAGEKQLLIQNALNLSGLVVTVNQIIISLCVLFAYSTILIFMDWKLSILAGVLIIALLLLVNPIIMKIRKIAMQARSNSRLFQRKIIDYMFAMRLIKLFGRDDKVIFEMESIVRKEVGLLRRGSLYSLIIEPAQELMVIFSVGILLLISFFSAGDSIESVLPALLAYVLVLHKCNTRVAILNSIRTTCAKSLAGLQFVSDFLSSEATVKRNLGIEKINVNWQSIDCDGLSFTYAQSEQEVLGDVHLSIDRGHTVAFVGESGSGKSTFVNILIGLLFPTSGSVKIDGISSSEADPELWQSQFSMVSQNDLILNRSIKDNLLFSNEDASQADIEAACKQAQIHDFIFSLDEGYDSKMGELGSKVSGGQVQRIAFARAILKGAPVLILDEATSALDNVTEKKIMNTINNKQNKTVIMIAHRLTTVIDADVIYVFDKGQIVDSGTHQQLISRSGKYQQMWECSSMVAPQ